MTIVTAHDMTIVTAHDMTIVTAHDMTIVTVRKSIYGNCETQNQLALKQFHMTISSIKAYTDDLQDVSVNSITVCCF